MISWVERACRSRVSRNSSAVKLLFNQVESAIVATAFALDSSTDNLLKLLRQERDARYVVFDLTNYWDQGTVTDNDIEFEYQENSDRYYLPADTRVDYLALSVEALAAELVLDEEEIRRAYDANAIVTCSLRVVRPPCVGQRR